MRWLSVALAFFSMLLLTGALLSYTSLKITTSTPTVARSASSIFQWLWSRIEGEGVLEWKAMNQNLSYSSFGPNVSACHPSMSLFGGVHLNCCPPIPDPSEEAIDFELPDLSSAPIRLRRPAHEVIDDEEYLAKYRRAVAIMKSLPETHPHNFIRQAGLHCIYCTGSYDQVDSPLLFKIHSSWLFFPWHRAYLYFHERILGKLIGDDSFAIPYWQWDHPDGMYIPDIFLNGSLLDQERDEAHLPPTVSDNNYNFAERGLKSSDQISYNLNLLYTQMVSGAKKLELFMGCPLHPGQEGFCDGSGTLEIGPHNALHSWVGSGHNPGRKDMGAFYAAARDPIFYAHHSNVDRLWTVWKNLHPSKPDITDDIWLDTHFFFYDENLVFRRIKIRDLLDISKLGYRFQETTLPWLNARPKPAVDPKVARSVLKRRRLTNPNPLPVGFGKEGRVLNESVTVEVLRPRRQRAQRKLGEEEGDEEEEVLVVYGIETKNDTFTKFDVYVNVVDEEAVVAAGARAREFAGTFVMMRAVRFMTKRGEEEGKKSLLKLGISELLEDLQAAEDERVWVTLVPEGATGRNVVVGGVRIEFMR